MLDVDWPKWRALYQDTVFLLKPNVWQMLQHTPRFTIVTAYNPQGKPYTKSQNQLLHQKLIGATVQEQTFEMIGSSIDEKHQEVSLIITGHLPEGILLAKQFNQNALYWVVNDNLMLCATSKPIETMTYIDKFSHRVRVK